MTLLRIQVLSDPLADFVFEVILLLLAFLNQGRMSDSHWFLSRGVRGAKDLLQLSQLIAAP